MFVVFIETKLFTKQLPEYLTDDEYKNLQSFLLEKPNAGPIIQGTGGLRKLRWSSGNRGKRGGVRIIYYWQVNEDQIYFVTLYAKNEAVDLTAQEKKVFKEMIARW